MLVTFDKLTFRPRRAVRAWLAARRHRITYRSSVHRECACGWTVGTDWVIGSDGTEIRQMDPGERWETAGQVETLPPGTDMPAAVAERLDAHIDTARLVDKGLLAYLLSCAYCVAMWAAAPVAASAVLWEDNRVWQAAMLALGARAVAGALSAQLTPPDEAEEEPVA